MTFHQIDHVSRHLPSEEANASEVNGGLQRILNRLNQRLAQDLVVQPTLNALRQQLGVDRVVLYYFYSQWRGQVTSEALSEPILSIYGSSGPDGCFDDAYAQLYLAGRVSAIADITTAQIHACHLEFLQGLQVRANLVAPILVQDRLWGLLVAHHCHSTHEWTEADIALIKQTGEQLAMAPAIQNS